MIEDRYAALEAAEEEGGKEGDVRKRVDRLLSSLHARFFGRVGIPIPFLPLRRRLHVVDDDLDAAAAEYYLLVVVGRGREGSIGHPSEWGVGCHGDVLTRRERGRRRKEERGRKMTGKQNGPLSSQKNKHRSLSLFRTQVALEGRFPPPPLSFLHLPCAEPRSSSGASWKWNRLRPRLRCRRRRSLRSGRLPTPLLPCRRSSDDDASPLSLLLLAPRRLPPLRHRQSQQQPERPSARSLPRRKVRIFVLGTRNE